MENNILNTDKSESSPLSADLINALVHTLYTFFAYLLFIVPFDLWKKALVRLSNQKKNKSLSIDNIKGLWPFLSFIKVFILEFAFDGLIFSSYFIGFVVGIITWINDGAFSDFITMVVGSYFAPIPLSLLRDLIQLSTLPFKKFLNWLSKPAQFMDLEIRNK